MSLIERSTQQAAPEVRGPKHSARVGMIGAGQLARMSFQAAVSLDVELTVLAAHDGQPAARAGATWLAGEPSDFATVAELAANTEVVTFDHELVQPALIEDLTAKGVLVRPGAAALRMASDKLHARTQMRALGFPVPHFAEVATPAEAEAFAADHGWPIVLKSVSGGYDGRGVRVANSADEARQILAAGGSWLAEEFVDIAMELSVLVARTPSGFVQVYPIAQTTQEDGICREVVIPADIPDGLATEVRELATSLVNGIDACGIVAVEMFITQDGHPVICEIATRPHNSGHVTIEACVTSQFENHLRGVLDWPLGSTEMRAPAAAMVNVLGSADGKTPLRLPAALAVEGASVHLYGKTELPGRKVGHVTATGETTSEALETARACVRALSGQ